MDQSVLSEAQDLLGDAIALRRKIHEKPELGLELPLTQQAVLESIDGLGLEVHLGQRISSVVAVLRGGEPGPTTLLRGDMDALPLTEDTGAEYASKSPGLMHACGHDAHVAMLSQAARLLSERRSSLAGNVVFMFQPGEEGYAGARIMLEEGLLERFGAIDRAHALHITPIIPSGVIASKDGTIFASSDSFAVTITGRGGHASTPERAVDPIPVACELVGALQTMMTRRVPAFDPGVLTVGSITAGTTTNVIPETALILGTIRAVSETTREVVLEGLTRVAEHIAAAHMCVSSVETVAESYPVVVNDKPASERTLSIAASLLGEESSLHMPTPIMGAEDWSFVLQKVPGAMAFLGAQPDGDGPVAPNHSNRMVIDEDAMAKGIAMHAALAMSA